MTQSREAARERLERACAERLKGVAEEARRLVRAGEGDIEVCVASVMEHATLSALVADLQAILSPPPSPAVGEAEGRLRFAAENPFAKPGWDPYSKVHPADLRSVLDQVAALQSRAETAERDLSDARVVLSRSKDRVSELQGEVRTSANQAAGYLAEALKATSERDALKAEKANHDAARALLRSMVDDARAERDAALSLLGEAAYLIAPHFSPTHSAAADIRAKIKALIGEPSPANSIRKGKGE